MATPLPSARRPDVRAFLMGTSSPGGSRRRAPVLVQFSSAWSGRYEPEASATGPAAPVADASGSYRPLHRGEKRSRLSARGGRVGGQWRAVPDRDVVTERRCQQSAVRGERQIQAAPDTLALKRGETPAAVRVPQHRPLLPLPEHAGVAKDRV